MIKYLLILALILGGYFIYSWGDIPLAFALDTGFKSPASTGEDYNQWETPADAFVSDDYYATQSAVNQRQDYYDFTFAVPAGATIDGIEATFEGDTADYYTGTMLNVDLSHDGGTTYASSIKEVVDNSNSPGDITVTIGGATDTWGRTWTDSELSNANFRLRAENVNVIGTWGVDHIQIKVYYTEASGGPVEEHTRRHIFHR